MPLGENWAELLIWQTIERLVNKLKMINFFIETQRFRSSPFPVNSYFTNFSWSRSLALVLTTLLAAALHVGLFIWYLNRPEPPSIKQAMALPMINIELAAAGPSEPLKSEAPPPPEPPKPEVKPPPKKEPPKIKPKLKPLPKPVKKAEIKQPRKPEAPKPPEHPPMMAPVPPVPSVAPPTPPQNQGQSNANAKVTAARVNAGYLNNPKPHYPEVARENHWEGLVMLRVQVNAEGNCSQIFVQRSSGHVELDNSALSAVKHWRFIPAKRGDVPMTSWVTVPIEFELE